MKLVIDRSKWYRGKNGDKSRLLLGANGRTGGSNDPDTGKMCCLGFLALTSGHSKRDIKNVACPEGLTKPKGKLKELVKANGDGWVRTSLCDKLIVTNDEPRVKDREKKITALFAKIGVEVEFVGGEA